MYKLRFIQLFRYFKKKLFDDSGIKFRIKNNTQILETKTFSISLRSNLNSASTLYCHNPSLDNGQTMLQHMDMFSQSNGYIPLAYLHRPTLGKVITQTNVMYKPYFSKWKAKLEQIGDPSLPYGQPCIYKVFPTP